MPIYEYRCPDGTVKEELHFSSSPPEKSGDCKKIPSAGAVVFKGAFRPEHLKPSPGSIIREPGFEREAKSAAETIDKKHDEVFEATAVEIAKELGDL